MRKKVYNIKLDKNKIITLLRVVEGLGPVKPGNLYFCTMVLNPTENILIDEAYQYDILPLL